MNKEPNIIKCKLCEIPIGMSFEKLDDNNTYCYICGETILKFYNSFTVNKIKYTAYFDNQFNQGLKHRYGIASKFYINELLKERLDLIKYNDYTVYK